MSKYVSNVYIVLQHDNVLIKKRNEEKYQWQTLQQPLLFQAVLKKEYGPNQCSQIKK